MNDINHMIAVMTAANEGKTIQILYHDDIDAGWIDTTRPLWDWRTCDYRVKPAEPRRVWLNIRGDVMPSVYMTRAEADKFAFKYGLDECVECVEFVEVMK